MIIIAVPYAPLTGVTTPVLLLTVARFSLNDVIVIPDGVNVSAVSYTHLTLPTIA